MSNTIKLTPKPEANLKSPKLDPDSQAGKIVKTWKAQTLLTNVKPETTAYALAQAWYMQGVTAALGDSTPPILVMYCMSGRDIADLL